MTTDGGGTSGKLQDARIRMGGTEVVLQSDAVIISSQGFAQALKPLADKVERSGNGSGLPLEAGAVRRGVLDGLKHRVLELIEPRAWRIAMRICKCRQRLGQSVMQGSQ